MESLNIFKIIKKGAWMASDDLKDAFFTVPVYTQIASKNFDV